ncbi:2OG-Fe(II) oxygenase [Bartonella rattaustraliani]|uniref:2OG-Fe(II) oxygenase n=1 Tax=Bartonella rattaustraliani TaxID=481139 RepID=UPI0006847A07|nr:2OG-Fe(II) oxygenase [Bartonella rattaustraliani]
MTPGIDLEPHIDDLEWTLPKDIDFKLKHQLSANIYLQVPEKGGELELWNILPSAQEYEKLKGNRHYGINRHDMPPPAVTLKPELGDLIFLNPPFIHAVRPVADADRITASAFIGIEADDKSLVYWS